MGKFGGKVVEVLCPFLVEVPTALGRATQTRNLILLDWEMIICMPKCVSFAQTNEMPSYRM